MKSDDFICGRHFRTRFWCGLIVGGFFCASAVSLRAAPNLAPEMTIHFPLNKDPRPWVIADSLTNGPAGSVMVYTSEWVPKGDSIEAWKEMFDEKTILTTETITHHLDIWKALMARDAPGTTVTVITNADGTSTVGYKAIAADEMGISRYIQGKDGIYILSYRVRPRVNSEARMKIWEDILSSATLVKNNVQGGR